MNKKIISLLLVACLALALCACGSEEGKISVQQVGSLSASAQGGSRYAGMVVSEDVTTVSRDSSKTILELYVSVGQEVKAGDKLFTYDSEALALELEKQQLELEKMKNEQVGYAEQLVKLEQQLANTWNETEKSRITLEINTLKTTQLENDYAIIAKENSIADIQQVLANIDVICPVDGTIRAINEDDPSLPYITIQREGAFRIKASLNELNMYSISPGSRVKAVSRIDSSVFWTGTVSTIDTDAPEQSENDYYYGYNDPMSSTSGYVFYVELDSTENLLLGQHVYIELLTEEKTGVWLPEGFIAEMGMDEETFETTATVWVAGAGDKLESRTLTLGMYDPASFSYEVLSGLSAEDWVASPWDELCVAGTPVSYRSPGDFTGGMEG